LEKEKRLYKLEEALENLNPEQKHCVSLFYLEEKTYQQIATQTGMSIKQVKSHIQNGKRNIKKQLGILSLILGLLITLLS
ncbi:MAG: sigma-70 family RNA polymerase sigma factor, partial [Bernardetiaceae bacterium]|nr:sigma-70 family RNA polymerase sigma factor [Bernardetiaceae bacterium]